MPRLTRNFLVWRDVMVEPRCVDARPRLDAETLRRRWDLVLPHRQELLAIARRRVDSREDAEDIVSTAFVRTVEHAALDESRVGAFLCTTVMRLSVDVHRDRARQLAVGRRDATRSLAPAPVEELVRDEAEARWLSSRLDQCPERERQVLTARVQGMTAQQTSAHLGLSPKATENAYTRVRQRAQGLLAATLAGVGVLVLGARRAVRPIALVPVAALLTLAVVGGTAAPAATAPTAPATRDAASEPSPAPAQEPATAPVASEATSSPVAPSASPLTATAVDEDPEARQPVRLTVPVPVLVDPSLMDPGDTTVERRHEESFEDSVQRCVSGIDLGDPTADPCR